MTQRVGGLDRVKKQRSKTENQQKVPLLYRTWIYHYLYNAGKVVTDTHLYIDAYVRLRSWFAQTHVCIYARIDRGSPTHVC